MAVESGLLTRLKNMFYPALAGLCFRPAANRPGIHPGAGKHRGMEKAGGCGIGSPDPIEKHVLSRFTRDSSWGGKTLGNGREKMVDGRWRMGDGRLDQKTEVRTRGPENDSQFAIYRATTEPYFPAQTSANYTPPEGPISRKS